MSEVPQSIEITSLFALDDFAKAVAAQTSVGSVIALDGPLGAGKTTFVQFLAKHLGIEDPVTSPTFSIVHSYPWKKTSQLHHLDFYRLQRIDEVLKIGFTELIDEHNHVIVVEWPGVAKPLLPDSTLWLEFKVKEGNNRQIVNKVQEKMF